MLSSSREAYHIPTSNEPVKIRVAQPYHEYKPEFSRALSNHIANGLSNSGRTLEIQLEPETLGNILIKFRTGKEGTRVELCCASEKRPCCWKRMYRRLEGLSNTTRRLLFP